MKCLNGRGQTIHILTRPELREAEARAVKLIGPEILVDCKRCGQSAYAHQVNTAPPLACACHHRAAA